MGNIGCVLIHLQTSSPRLSQLVFQSNTACYTCNVPENLPLFTEVISRFYFETPPGWKGTLRVQVFGDIYVLQTGSIKLTVMHFTIKYTITIILKIL